MINNVSLQGRLTFTPELRSTPSGAPVTKFQIASDRPYKNSEGKYQADFIDIVAWRSTAEFAVKYFNKGDLINIVGRIESSNYVDREGNNRKSMYVKASEITFCGPKKEGKHPNPAFDSPTAINDFEAIDEDDEDEDLPL